MAPMLRQHGFFKKFLVDAVGIDDWRNRKVDRFLTIPGPERKIDLLPAVAGLFLRSIRNLCARRQGSAGVNGAEASRRNRTKPLCFS
jgi:hypothetical protein